MFKGGLTHKQLPVAVIYELYRPEQLQIRADDNELVLSVLTDEWMPAVTLTKLTGLSKTKIQKILAGLGYRGKIARSVEKQGRSGCNMRYIYRRLQ